MRSFSAPSHLLAPRARRALQRADGGAGSLGGAHVGTELRLGGGDAIGESRARQRLAAQHRILDLAQFDDVMRPDNLLLRKAAVVEALVDDDIEQEGDGQHEEAIGDEQLAADGKIMEFRHETHSNIKVPAGAPDHNAHHPARRPEIFG